MAVIALCKHFYSHRHHLQQTCPRPQSVSWPALSRVVQVDLPLLAETFPYTELPEMTHVILLRGVMPSGRNRVPMAQLRAALTAAGLADVRSHIQSGNIIAGSRLAPARLALLVHQVIARDIGADIAVIVRTPAQIERVLADNPFADADSSRVYFTLLAAPPAPQSVRDLLALEFEPDAVCMRDDTIYTRYATRLSDSRYTNNFFERKLKVAATTRNFNTLSRLLELAQPRSD